MDTLFNAFEKIGLQMMWHRKPYRVISLDFMVSRENLKYLISGCIITDRYTDKISIIKIKANVQTLNGLTKIKSVFQSTKLYTVYLAIQI